MTRLQPVVYVVGILVVLLGIAMAPPLLVDLADGNRDWHAFALAAVVTFGFGGMMMLGSRGANVTALGVRQAFVMTVAAWAVLSFFGALPFMFGEAKLSFTDAMFESVSGLTTTGATVIVGLDDAPRGLLLWRSMLHFMGGIGIIVMAVLILPFLRVGGQQLFRSESSDKSEKPFPRMAQVTAWIGIVYLGMNLACMIALMLAGMGWFDALNHAMAAVSTGGFSTKDASVGYFANPAAEWILIVFMAAGALPLTWYIRLLREGREGLGDPQVAVMLAVFVAASAVTGLYVLLRTDYGLWDALRLGAFNSISIITTTGFVTADYVQWGAFASGAFFIFYFIGGCTGSTSGSVKIFRWQILLAALLQQFSRMHQPSRVTVLLYDGRRVGEDTILAVISFFFVYVATLGALTAAVTLTGVDFISAVTGVAASMGNVGPGLGPVIGPCCTFQDLPDEAIWLMSLAMLLGRLELFTILILLTPSFWRMWTAPGRISDR